MRARRRSGLEALEGLAGLRRGGPLLGLLAQATLEKRRHVLVCVGLELPEGLGLLLQVSREEFDVRARVVGEFLGEKLVAQNAEAVEIGILGYRVPAKLLRARIGRVAQHLALHRQPRLVCGARRCDPCQAEVGEDDPAGLLLLQNVPGPQVSMDHAGLVGGLQGGCNLPEDLLAAFQAVGALAWASSESFRVRPLMYSMTRNGVPFDRAPTR